MPSRNEVFLLGHAGRDAEVLQTSTGKWVAKFPLATGGGQKKDGTKYKSEWHKIVVWGSLAEACKPVVAGAEVELKGRLVYPSWTDPQGNKRYGSEIIATKISVNGCILNENQNKDRHVSDEQVAHAAFVPPAVEDEEIPF